MESSSDYIARSRDRLHFDKAVPLLKVSETIEFLRRYCVTYGDDQWLRDSFVAALRRASEDHKMDVLFRDDNNVMAVNYIIKSCITNSNHLLNDQAFAMETLRLLAACPSKDGTMIEMLTRHAAVCEPSAPEISHMEQIIADFSIAAARSARLWPDMPRGESFTEFMTELHLHAECYDDNNIALLCKFIDILITNISFIVVDHVGETFHTFSAKRTYGSTCDFFFSDMLFVLEHETCYDPIGISKIPSSIAKQSETGTFTPPPNLAVDLTPVRYFRTCISDAWNTACEECKQGPSVVWQTLKRAALDYIFPLFPMLHMAAKLAYQVGDTAFFNVETMEEALGQYVGQATISAGLPLSMSSTLCAPILESSSSSGNSSGSSSSSSYSTSSETPIPAPPNLLAQRIAGCAIGLMAATSLIYSSDNSSSETCYASRASRVFFIRRIPSNLPELSQCIMLTMAKLVPSENTGVVCPSIIQWRCCSSNELCAWPTQCQSLESIFFDRIDRAIVPLIGFVSTKVKTICIRKVNHLRASILGSDFPCVETLDVCECAHYEHVKGLHGSVRTHFQDCSIYSTDAVQTANPIPMAMLSPEDPFSWRTKPLSEPLRSWGCWNEGEKVRDVCFERCIIADPAIFVDEFAGSDFVHVTLNQCKVCKEFLENTKNIISLIWINSTFIENESSPSQEREDKASAQREGGDGGGGQREGGGKKRRRRRRRGGGGGGFPVSKSIGDITVKLDVTFPRLRCFIISHTFPEQLRCILRTPEAAPNLMCASLTQMRVADPLLEWTPSKRLLSVTYWGITLAPKIRAVLTIMDLFTLRHMQPSAITGVVQLQKNDSIGTSEDMLDEVYGADHWEFVDK